MITIDQHDKMRFCALIDQALDTLPLANVQGRCALISLAATVEALADATEREREEHEAHRNEMFVDVAESF